MKQYEPLNVLPVDFQVNWQAQLIPNTPTTEGVFRLVDIQRTAPTGYQGQRLVAQVIDENGFPVPNVPVAFAYSTAGQYLVNEEFKWRPPLPYRADIVLTSGGGQVEHVQGSVVRQGEPGGVTVYVLDPTIASDVVAGMGMLADHTGVRLTFQLRRNGVVSLAERLAAIEARLDRLEQA
ncbi:MAG: hypothetical protein FOGNACKC_00901 [Anaerolineae bacterium]|nr:hypothetical protein [Anaerolineae bacterium]